MAEIANLIDEMVADARHGWSIGTFGAIGEFMRDADEPATITHEGDVCTIITPRGGMRIAPDPALRVVAYDTLGSDGETWGQSLAFCLPAPAQMEHAGIRPLGLDTEALRPEDRDSYLYDLGDGRGHVRFGLRTRDAAMIDALERMKGRSIFDPGDVMKEALRSQPHRVVLSPVGRVEIYSPIPMPDGKSPEGPHTHLLPQMLAARRTHAANAPIPDGFQPVLMLHPRSPWRDGLGQRVPFDEELDAVFENLLARYGLDEDMSVRADVEEAVEEGVAPESYRWPETRRGRAAARITLRRLARAGRPVSAWRQRYDRGAEAEPDEDAARHA